MSIYSKIEGETLQYKVPNQKIVGEGEKSGFTVNDDAVVILMKGSENGGKVTIGSKLERRKRIKSFSLDEENETVTTSVEFSGYSPSGEIQTRQLNATFSIHPIESKENSISQNTPPSHQKP